MGTPPGAVRCYYELHLLGLAGYQPQLFRCVHCGELLQPEVNFLSLERGGALCPSMAPTIPRRSPCRSRCSSSSASCRRAPGRGRPAASQPGDEPPGGERPGGLYRLSPGAEPAVGDVSGAAAAGDGDGTEDGTDEGRRTRTKDRRIDWGRRTRFDADSGISAVAGGVGQGARWDRVAVSHTLVHALEEWARSPGWCCSGRATRTPKPGAAPCRARGGAFGRLVFLFKLAYQTGIDVEAALARGEAKADGRYDDLDAASAMLARSSSRGRPPRWRRWWTSGVTVGVGPSRPG